MTTLILTPDGNTQNHKDFTGAFWPGAQTFQHAHGGTIVKVPLRAVREVYRAIDVHQPDVIAFFCHGLRRGLPQMGISLGQVEELSKRIAEWSTSPTLILYACSAAEGSGPAGDGGLCDALRDHLVAAGAAGCRVFGHSTAGHAFQNPHVRVFDAATNVGGRWVVVPGSPHWKAWREALKGPLWAMFPFLGPDELAAHLEALS